MKHLRTDCAAHHMMIGGHCINCGAQPDKGKPMTADAVASVQPCGTPTKSDDRNIGEGAGTYCTDCMGKPCRYEANHANGKTTACGLFLTARGMTSLRIGRSWQSIRCAACRAVPAGDPIPDHNPPKIKPTSVPAPAKVEAPRDPDAGKRVTAHAEATTVRVHVNGMGNFYLTHAAARDLYVDLDNAIKRLEIDMPRNDIGRLVNTP